MTNPTTYEVTFPLAWLRAMRLLAAGNKDRREHLRGVVIAYGYLAATDGCILGALRDERFDGLPEIIIPNDAIDGFLRAVKGCPPDADVTVRWTPTADEGSRLCTPGTLALATVQQGFLAPAGKYPYFPNMLIPNTSTEARKPAQFSWAKLACVEKVAEALGSSKGYHYKVHLTPNGKDPARLRIPRAPYFDGVIMPCLNAD